MKRLILLCTLLLTDILQATNPGGKTLAELVRERFERNPAGTQETVETSPPKEPNGPAPAADTPTATDETAEGALVTPPETPEPSPEGNTSKTQEADPPTLEPTAPAEPKPAPPPRQEGSPNPETEGAPTLPPEIQESEPDSAKEDVLPPTAEESEPVPEDETPPPPIAEESEPKTEVETLPPPVVEKPEPESGTATPQVAETSAPLSDFGPETETYKIKSGDTLGRVARSLYRSSSYASLLQDYNKVDPRRLRIGQDLKTPSFSELTSALAPELLHLYPLETGLLLEVHQEYHELEDKLSSGPVNQERKATIEAIQNKITRIQDGLSTSKEGASGTPTRSLAQLKSLQRTLTGIYDGDFTITSKKGAAGRTHLALSLAEAIKWAP